MVICQPLESEFKTIINFVLEFELDNRELKLEEFLILKRDNTILAFGRLKKHKNCDELCTLGVIVNERRKGYATLLTKALIKKSTKPLFLVCIIPKLFIPIGFKIVSSFPIELTEKLNYCTKQLIVKEKYLVLQYSDQKERS